MDYQPTEAELNGLTGDECANDAAQAAYYVEQQAQREEWERQAHYHEAEQAEQQDEEAYYALLAYVEG